MINKIDEIDINQNSSMYNCRYHFLNSDDFNNLGKRLLCNDNTAHNTNTIKIGADVYIKFSGDLSDFGNEIGLNIGQYINIDILGFEKEDFISGLEHGISIIDGSHK